jgi:hypothetical protein
VPFEARTAASAVQLFCDHLNRLLNTTLTRARLGFAGEPGGKSVVNIRLKEGVDSFAGLKTAHFGSVFLQLAQLVTTDPAGKRWHRLRTVRYRYSLSGHPEHDALVRWDYSREQEHGSKPWCRHHIQGSLEVKLPGGVAKLNDFHLPTGYVAVEDIVRFCIVDLGVKPLSPDWDGILRESSRAFRAGLATGA